MGADVRQHVVLLLRAAPPTVISVKIKPIQPGEEVGAHIYRSLEYGVSFQRAENGPESLPCFRLRARDSGGLAVAEEGAGPRGAAAGQFRACTGWERVLLPSPNCRTLEKRGLIQSFSTTPGDAVR